VHVIIHLTFESCWFFWLFLTSLLFGFFPCSSVEIYEETDSNLNGLILFILNSVLTNVNKTAYFKQIVH